MGSEQAVGVQANSSVFDFSTRPIVQAVTVLAVGDIYRASDRQVNQPYSSVTLLVSIEEAAKLIFARDFFNVNMTLALRGEEDLAVDPNVPSVGVGTVDFDAIGNTPPAGAGN